MVTGGGQLHKLQLYSSVNLGNRFPCPEGELRHLSVEFVLRIR